MTTVRTQGAVARVRGKSGWPGLSLRVPSHCELGARQGSTASQPILIINPASRDVFLATMGISETDSSA